MLEKLNKLEIFFHGMAHIHINVISIGLRVFSMRTKNRFFFKKKKHEGFEIFESSDFVNANLIKISRSRFTSFFFGYCARLSKGSLISTASLLMNDFFFAYSLEPRGIYPRKVLVYT